MAIYSDLVIDQGSYFSTVINAAQNSVFDFDLTGYIARGTIRKSYSSTTYYEFDISIADPTNGRVTLSLESEVTAGIKAGRYLFDVEIIQTSNERITRIAEGQIEVMPGVTSGAYNPGNEVGQSIKNRLVTSSSDPTASNIADGTFEMWKNSNTNVLKLWANDGGTMKSITLT